MEEKKKILVTGASGFIGKELVVFLNRAGYEVWRLVRNKKEASIHIKTIFWDPEKKELDASAIEGFGAVIHLSGENIASGRWTKEKKKAILDSRVESTQFLSQTLAQLEFPPSCFISASAVGIYGDRGNLCCNEYSPHGTDFLAKVCEQWEAATHAAKDHSIRTVTLRFGIVLSNQGGALAKMLIPFKWGLGGVLGTGRQYMSWISLEDLLAIILFVIKNPGMEGPYNAVTPYPVTNALFTQTLSRVLERPAILPLPAFLLKLLFGKEMAEQVFLNSTRVEPLRLTQAGYSFYYSDLEVALGRIIHFP